MASPTEITVPQLARLVGTPEAPTMSHEDHASEVEAVAERFAATAFDVEGVFWSHRGESCTFDTMLAEFGLGAPPPLRLAGIVRGADTARPELAPQVAGLLAVSLGPSRMFRDDLALLEAGMSVYDALYRGARDAADETHNWPAAAGRVSGRGAA